VIKKIFSISCLSIILLVGISQIPYSYSLSCAGPTIEEEFSKSQWVFLGKFISETDAGIFSDNTILNFEVIEYYKGESSPIMKVLNNPNWRHSFSSEEAIIFAGSDLFGNPELFLCTNSGETADEHISKVRQMSSGFFEEDLGKALRLAEERAQIQLVYDLLPILILATATIIGIIFIKRKRKKLEN